MSGEDTPKKTGRERSLANLAPAWQPGQSGNPNGRPKGSRTILAEDFCKAVQEDFAANGKAALEIMRLEKPAEYAKMIAGMLPKELDANVTGDLSPELKKWLGMS